MAEIGEYRQTHNFFQGQGNDRYLAYPFHVDGDAIQKEVQITFYSVSGACRSLAMAGATVLLYAPYKILV